MVLPNGAEGMTTAPHVVTARQVARDLARTRDTLVAVLLQVDAAEACLTRRLPGLPLMTAVEARRVLDEAETALREVEMMTGPAIRRLATMGDA